ncbi:MAG TPA: hypothetical protein VFI39_04670 [Gemmatimonadales bacterium]|nr:hypothetical protein [Gemmatimonadales bacterium]
MPVRRGWPAATNGGYQLSAIGYQLVSMPGRRGWPAATNGGYQLSAIGYQLSAISWSRCPSVGGGLRPPHTDQGSVDVGVASPHHPYQRIKP